MTKPAGEKVPKQMQSKFEEITSITDAFCQQHLNNEYAELSRKLAASLCRKRPSPLVKGQAKSWACGMVHALGDGYVSNGPQLVLTQQDRRQSPGMDGFRQWFDHRYPSSSSRGSRRSISSRHHSLST